jgi:very-short-patch-repair endonuclease
MDTSGFHLEHLSRHLLDCTPCDSPIEDIFYREFQKCVASEAVILRQFECQTPVGAFYLDFLVSRHGRHLGFECDGKDFHDRPRDSKRDRAIVDAGQAHRIYRLRGHDISHHLHDALDLIRIREPSLFSERGHHIIEALAAREPERRDEIPEYYWGFSSAAFRWFVRKDDENDVYDEALVCWTD